ncbi:zf-TFIIB domain-containing protein [Kribbella sp. NPDC049584]|uniref:TFIIB-type zinc ribbon-containing protein n=1 Tax=Kribbella sp. NPDC049584 TaxID=3154833 RepID=UPI003431E63A
MESLTCPKCRGEMRSYERNSVTVDQCGECRGIFLDRGELERLVDAELQYNSPSPQPRYEEKRYEEKKRYDDRRYDDDRRYGNQHPRKKKKSFLEELFD